QRILNEIASGRKSESHASLSRAENARSACRTADQLVMFSLRASNISMRAIVTTRNGDVRALKIEERPDPIPSKGQVLIRVKASGLNFADILARQGLYPDGPSKPCVMGYEVSGTVEEVGDGTDQTLIGNSV